MTPLEIGLLVVLIAGAVYFLLIKKSASQPSQPVQPVVPVVPVPPPAPPAPVVPVDPNFVAANMADLVALGTKGNFCITIIDINGNRSQADVNGFGPCLQVFQRADGQYYTHA